MNIVGDSLDSTTALVNCTHSVIVVFAKQLSSVVNEMKDYGSQVLPVATCILSVRNSSAPNNPWTMCALPGMHIFRVSEVMTIAHRKHRCYDALPLLRSYEKMLVQHSFVEKSCRRVSSMETLPWRLGLSSVIKHRLEWSHSGHISSKDSKERRGGWSTTKSQSWTPRVIYVTCTTCIGRKCTRFERFLGAFLSWDMFHDSMLQRTVRKSEKEPFWDHGISSTGSLTCVCGRKWWFCVVFFTLFPEFFITNGEAWYATVWGGSCSIEWYLTPFRKTKHLSNDEVKISKDRYRPVRKNDEKPLQGRLFRLDFLSYVLVEKHRPI